MLDKRTEMMLGVANLLTAGDLDQIRANAPKQESIAQVPAPHAEEHDMPAPLRDADAFQAASPAGIPQGERERRRTRKSKIATQCVGSERAKHNWWPVGTELLGRIEAETFTAVVVENAQVKSGRSLRISSGTASGKVCRTPTRAALEATEHYRQANSLGRGGGVTNGW